MRLLLDNNNSFIVISKITCFVSCRHVTVKRLKRLPEMKNSITQKTYDKHSTTMIES